MYCDHTVMDNVETAGQLLYAAKKYLIPHLAHTCRDFLLQNTYINTLWDVLAIAEDLHEEELLSACLKVHQTACLISIQLTFIHSGTWDIFQLRTNDEFILSSVVLYREFQITYTVCVPGKQKNTFNILYPNN